MGQGRLLTLKEDVANRRGAAVIAVGDPTIGDFEVLPNPRMIRVIGRRAGVTDLSITTADGQTYSFELRVVYDLDLLRGQLREVFPTAEIKIGQIRDNLVVEGEAQSAAQVTQIISLLEGYLRSARGPQGGQGQQAQDGRRPAAGPRRRSLPLPASATNRPYLARSAEPRRMERRRGGLMLWDKRRPERAAAFATRQPLPNRESSI